jgi:D-glycero-D-manno-heptose 1,7-bisphosphate phosphatase
MKPRSRAAVFLDRDGTLIEDVGYLRDATQVRLLPGAANALCRLHAGGFLLVVVSNQSGLSRGLITPTQARAVADRVEECLQHEGVELDASYCCPHKPEDGCSCRKPGAGLLRGAVSEWGIDLGCSFFVGDKPSDIEAGRRAGCRTVLLDIGAETAPETNANFVANDWCAAADWVLSKVGEPAGDHPLVVRFPSRRVLVVGDVMLDEYLWGSVRRVSQEAPVPVVELERRSDAPGGAANAAANAAGLGAKVFLVGVRGDDSGAGGGRGYRASRPASQPRGRGGRRARGHGPHHVGRLGRRNLRAVQSALRRNPPRRSSKRLTTPVCVCLRFSLR